MSDVYDDAPAPAVGIFGQQGASDPDRAERYLQQHRARAAAADSDFASIMRKRSDAIQQTRDALNQTIQELRARHTGAGPGQVNLPLLSLAAGMLQTTPGVASNFGNELGRGLGAMGNTIANQRMRDDEFLRGVADLQQKQGALEDIPLKDAALLARQKSLAEDRETGSLENALIRSKIDRPMSLGQGMIFDPKSGQVVNGMTGQQIPLGGSPGDQNAPTHVQLLGSDIHGDKYLQSITDPALRSSIQSFGDYDGQLPTMPRTPQAMQYMQNLMAMVKQYNPDFDMKEYKARQTAMQNWRGSGKLAQQSLFASNLGVHLPNAQEAAADLDPGSFKALNQIRNWASDQSDDPRVERFRMAVLPVVEEMTKFLGGGKPAEGTMQDWLHRLGEANGPRQLQAAFGELAKIMHGQLSNLANQKNSDLGLTGDRQVTPDTLLGSVKPGETSPADKLVDMLRNDISTPGGLYAVKRRAANNDLALKKETPLPSFSSEQFNQAAAQLKNPTDPELQKLSIADRRKLFDQYFGDGASAAVLAAKKR